MSLSSGIDQNNNDADLRGRFYPDLIPWEADPHANIALGAVLQNGNSAFIPGTTTKQDATDFDLLGCVKIETGTVGMGNQPALVIGEPGDLLQIKGGTALGSILVGNGVNTEELVAGASGLFLKTNPSAPLGVEWGVGGGGGGGVASVSAGNNITVSGTATNPIVAVANPLNATLNIGGQNITGVAPSAVSIIDVNAPNSQVALQSTGLSVYDAIGPSTNSISITKQQILIQSATDSVASTATGLSKTVGATPLTLSSSTAPIQFTPASGTNCNVSVDGAGNFAVSQSSAGGPTQPIVEVINTNGSAQAGHIDIYKNTNTPATNDGIGAISYHANNASATKVEYARIQADQRDITAGSENGSVSVYIAQNSPTPAEYFRFNGVSGTNQLYRNLDTLTSNITSSTGQLNIIQPTASGTLNIQTTGNGTIALSSTGGGSSIITAVATNYITLVSGSGNSQGAITLVASTNTTNGLGGVIISQSAGAQPQLKTGLTTTYANQPVNYYPAVHIDNGNSTSISIETPKVQYQNLVIMNMGITPTTIWNDVGGANGNVDCMFLAGGGYVWLGIGSSVLITDTNFSIIYQTITLAGTSSGAGSTRALAFWEDGIYVYIGGDFQSVNGNAQPQYGLTRIYLGGGPGFYVEDPIFDGASGVYGVNGTIEALAIFSGNLYAGGSFNTFAPGGTADYIFQVQNYTATGGSQTYTINLNLATNASVYALTPNGSNLFVGGSFTFPYNYLATYDGSNWNNVDGNSFNGPVYSTYTSSLGSYILVGGNFSHSGHSNLCYVDANTPTNPSTSAGVSPSTLGKNSVYASGYDMIQNTGTDVYKSTSFQSWTSLGQSNAGSTASTIFIYSGNPFASYTNYSNVRTNVANPQSATFSLPSTNFLYGGVAYQNATFGAKYLSQAFVADATANYYIPVGNPSCSFS